MPYDLKIDGRPTGTFETEADAIAAASAALRENADADLAITDTATGRPVAPGGSQNWREELASRIGF